MDSSLSLILETISRCKSRETFIFLIVVSICGNLSRSIIKTLSSKSLFPSSILLSSLKHSATFLLFSPHLTSFSSLSPSTLSASLSPLPLSSPIYLSFTLIISCWLSTLYPMASIWLPCALTWCLTSLIACCRLLICSLCIPCLSSTSLITSCSAFWSPLNLSTTDIVLKSCVTLEVRDFCEWIRKRRTPYRRSNWQVTVTRPSRSERVSPSAGGYGDSRRDLMLGSIFEGRRWNTYIYLF